MVLAATASLRTAWLVGAFVALAFATLAVGLAGDDLLAPFLLVAPLVPVIGVAAAYGPQQDPLETLVVTAPYGRTRLILVRTLAVLVRAAVAALLGLLPPGPPWIAVAWLGPALALVPVLLALSSYVGPRTGRGRGRHGVERGRRVSLRGLPSTWPVEATQQLVYLALAASPSPSSSSGRSRDRRIGAVAVNAVELTGVTKSYGRTRALDGVDLDVRPRRHRAPRPQRRRQDDAAADRRDLDRRRRRRGAAARPRPARRPTTRSPRSGASSATCRRSWATPAT